MGGSHETNIEGGYCLKRGGWGHGLFADLRGGGWQERGGGVFEGDLRPQMHTMVGHHSQLHS